MMIRKRGYIKVHRKNWDAIFKFLRALLNSSGVYNLLFALLKSSLSRYSLCFIILEIIFGFGETKTSPCNNFFSWVSLVDPYGSSFQKQHIQYQGDLSFCNFSVIIYWNYSGSMFPRITQITLHCSVICCNSSITY